MPKFCSKIFLIIGLTLAAGGMAADIRSTRHNLTGEKDISKLDERQVCSFCHTPAIAVGEGGVLTPEKMPHWQSSLAKEHSFTIYDDIGRMGLGKASVGSQSIACLSCHDSAQAFGIGKISENHPFGVPYRGALKGNNQINASLPSVSSAVNVSGEKEYKREAMHLKSLEDFRPVSKGTVESRTVWWVSATGQSSRRTRSDLPLYARNDSDIPGSDVPHIECSSCHDPHSANELFLRVPNEGSKLCLTCHDK